MKKILATLIAVVLVSAMVFALASCGNNPSDQPKTEKLEGTYNILVWTSEVKGVKEQVKEQIDRFVAANPGLTINATIEGIGEGEAATQMISSVEDGADLFFFAQDQLSRLVQAAALNPLGVETTKKVKESNDASSVKASTVSDKIYAYPATSDNGYFMYYDKSIVKAEHLDSLEDIIADCEAAGRLFSFNLEGSGWYNASFFFATGCISEWGTDATGKYVSVNDTFNSDQGLVALKGMQKLLKSKAYNDSANGADFDAAVKSAVVISGTWDSATVKGILGDNYGVTDLPSFTVDGSTYHLGSFSGNKLVGVKPQTDAKKAAVLQQLALFLTNKECQLERFEKFGWGPSNLDAQKDPKVANDETLSALALQSKYASPQLSIHGSWWDIAKTYATAAKTATSDKELKEALEAYEKAINGLFNMSTDEKESFTVIGKFADNEWNKDVAMSQKPEGTWYTDEPIDFKAGDEFQVRQGKAWDVQFGAVDATTGKSTKNNFVVPTDGKYYVKLVFDKATGEGVVTLEKVNPSTGWTVIGSINGDTWSIDLEMEPGDNGVWRTVNSYEMAEGTEFKVRQGKSWDVSYGNGTANFVVSEAGTYFVEFNPDTTVVTLVKA